MSMNGKPLAFPQAAPNVPIIGQPFTVQAISISVTVRGACNCGGENVAVELVAGTGPGMCPSCLRQFTVESFNPQTGQLAIGLVRTEEKPAS